MSQSIVIIRVINFIIVVVEFRPTLQKLFWSTPGPGRGSSTTTTQSWSYWLLIW